MKKIILLFLLTLFLSIGCKTSFVSASDYSFFKVAVLTVGENKVFINENFDTVDATPYIKDERALVPIRFMEKALGAEVKWEPLSQTASLKFKGQELKVTIGRKEAYVNNKEVILDVPAEINKGRTFVPLRFISENLGTNVRYFPENQKILISYVDLSGWSEYKENGLILKYPSNFTVLPSKQFKLFLVTPNGSAFRLRLEERDLERVIEEKREIYSNNGWNVFSEQAIPSYSPIEGVSINAKRIETQQYYDSYFFKLDGKNYVWDILNKSTYDNFLAEEIFLNIKEE